MRTRLIIISILFTSLTYAQTNLFEKADCVFHNESVDSNNFQEFVNSLDTIEIGYKFPQKEYTKLLDCLLLIDSTNSKLCYYKAQNSVENLCDTTFLRYFRYCIEKDFKTAFSYYNIGVSYINCMFSWNERDSLKIFELSVSEKSRLFELAERNIWLSYNNGLKEAVFTIGDIQKLKNEHLGTPLPIIYPSHDTLKIIVSIRDCGEFGGHIETIDIVNNGEESYIATFHSDSIYCQNEITRLSYNSKYNGVQSTTSQDNLNTLINALGSCEDIGAISNAPFEIAIIKEKDVLYQRIYLKWTHYLDFRMETFRF